MFKSRTIGTDNTTVDRTIPEDGVLFENGFVVNYTIGTIDMMTFFLPSTKKKGSLKGFTIKSGDKRPTKQGAGMTAKGVAKYRRQNPGSKLKTAVTGKVKPGSKDAKRRKSFCARSAGQMKKFPKAAKNPNSKLRQARRRWKC